MEDIKEAGRYGFRLFPLAILAMIGIFLNGYGTQILTPLLSPIQGTSVYQPALIISFLLIQIAGGVLVFAGVFGAVYRTVTDAQKEQPEN